MMREPITPEQEWLCGPYWIDWWMAEPYQQDDEDNHVDNCDCGEWEDSEFDDRCADKLKWRLAVIKDGGAFSPQFVAWADQPTYPSHKASEAGADHG